MPDPVSITEPKQLAVEGQDALVFFQVMLREMNLTEIQLQNFGGVDELRGFLEGLRRQSGFAQTVVSLGIVRDAEQNPKGAFQSVCSALNNTGLDKPNRPEKFAGNSPKVGALILPDATTKGMLETLCLRSVSDDPVMPCIEEYFRCVKKELSPTELPKIEEKARLHAFLASRPKPDLLLGEAASAGYWQWDNRAFDHVKQFLRNL